MESLSPECTPLKHAYDSCFNSWFEGYLQPALDNVASRSSSSSGIPSSTFPSSSSPTSTSAAADGVADPAEAGPSTQSTRLVTSWAHAIGRRAGIDASAVGHGERQRTMRPDQNGSGDQTTGMESSAQGGQHAVAAVDLPPIDTRGKTRAQIKAEEYERNCGSLWRNYQSCLQKAISENENLSTLLNAAREEHPLRDRTGLKGSVWDTENTPAYAERD